MEMFILTFGSLGFALAFAYINLRQTEQKLEESRKRRETGTVPAQ
ncbi:hypothetical protein RGUI_0999 [Rhodovulum sp. P5]|nr:hypothetical protein [Rhodovulum sp. P5]ARE39140.1 hypothetical protein RGUI_0999 [Rhodovulum sp. P5]